MSGDVFSTLGQLALAPGKLVNSIPVIGPLITQAAGSAIGMPFASTFANAAGSAVGNLFGGGGSHHDSAPAAPSPYVPKQDAAMGLPASLSQFGGFTPEQQSSNIATQGVYGGGEGPEENKYFLNLINRRLVDQTGNVGSTESVNPVENSFLSTLGLGGYKDTNDLLTKIHGYKG